LSKFFINKIQTIEDFLKKDKENHDKKLQALGY